MSSTSSAATGIRLVFSTPLAKLLGIGLMLLVLLIPACAINELVREREARRQQALAEVIGKWGGRQALTGPILRVPFHYTRTRIDTEGRRVDERIADAAYFLPARLAIRGEAKTELRRRGIFELPVYVATLKLEGQFAPADFSGWNLSAGDIDWARAELMIGLTEPRVLQADASLEWDGRPLPLRPSSGQGGAWQPPGVHAPLGAVLPRGIAAAGASFSLHLRVNGAEALQFAPTAEQTTLRLAGNWPHSGFAGGWLPAARRIDAEGFVADWSVSHLGRGYPQRWIESASVVEAVGKTHFGVDFTTPVDHYRMAERITRYAVMTLVFTFAVIWLTEVLSGRRAHLIQYGFVGAALCLFGLLQLSFAEHFGFQLAFCVAAAAVVAMVTLYSQTLLRSWRRSSTVGGVLSALYAYLYLILRAEDYALLGGSLALFAGLAAVMLLTRRIDWFAPRATAVTS